MIALQVSNPDFNLSRDTVDAVNSKGIEALFPIQAAVLKPAMEGRDLIGRARTGSGKTLAFALPVIEKINQVGPPPSWHCCPGLCIKHPRQSINSEDVPLLGVGRGVEAATCGTCLRSLLGAIVLRGIVLALVSR